MNKLDREKTGLVFGSFLAVIHAAWALAVAVMPRAMQSFFDWVFGLHFLEPIYTITVFNLIDAIMLVALTFVAGYVLGYVFAWVHNSLHLQRLKM